MYIRINQSYKIFLAHLAFCWVCISFLSCGESEIEVDESFVFVQPSNFPNPTYTFDNNPVTKEGFELGRRLFFDPLLSKDGSVSCNNCHIQAVAFADSQQHPLSVGLDDKLGTRNAPSLANLAFMNEYFWDGGVTHLDFVPINAIEADFEMGETLGNVVRKLNSDKVYPELFKKVFDIDKITSPYMLQALSQYMVMMVSANSRYDKYIRGEGEKLAESELKGLEVFSTKCASCHSGELFSDFSYRNNGLNTIHTDLGRGRISEIAADEGKFRVPSLRNVGLTAPYMHNAEFASLEEVLDHYSAGMVESPNLDEIFIKNGAIGISLTEDEKTQIISFLHTLADREFVSNNKFMNQ
jgi:cytochrome c peroxidase